MDKVEIQKLDLHLTGVKNLMNYKKIKNMNKNNIRKNKNYFREKSKSIKSIDITNKENDKNINEENNNNISIRTISNKRLNQRKKTKEVSFKLNNLVDEIKNEDDNYNDHENRNEVQKLIKNFSSISKESTMYRTKKRFLSSKQLKNNISEDKNNIKKKRKSLKSQKIIRSFSGTNLVNIKNNNNNNNNIKNNNKDNDYFFGGSQFITALDPLIGQRNLDKKKTDNKSNKSSKSYFFNKIKAEKKFLTYFDIKKIYFLDKKVYKPNKEFENKINKLKHNNSTEFLMNFNLDSYKMNILNLFQKHVSHQNFDIMRKNFELISKAWKWKDNLKCHIRRKRAVSTSQTEREIKYNQHKIDRDNRIKMRSKKEEEDKNKNENYFF